MSVFTAAPGWFWICLGVILVFAVEFVMWSCCVLSSRASRAEEAWDVGVGPCGKWVHVSDRVATGPDTTSADSGDTQPTVGA